MRMAFGLVGLLVTCGVIIMIWKYVLFPYNDAVLHKGRDAQDQAQQISGRAEDGTPIEETYSLYPDHRADGKLQDFQVANLTAASPATTKFGMQVNDVIVAAVDGHGVRTNMNGAADEESAKLAIRDAIAYSGQIIVRRGDNTISLPGGRPVAGSPVPANPVATDQPNPATPSPQPNPAPQPQPTDDNDPLKDLTHRIHPVGMQ